MPDSICLERSMLERAVIAAVQTVYDAKPEDRGQLRRNERATVNALENRLRNTAAQCEKCRLVVGHRVETIWTIRDT